MLWCLGEAWSFQAQREGYKLLFLLRAFFRLLGASSGIRTAEGMYQGYKFGGLSLKSRVEGAFVEALHAPAHSATLCRLWLPALRGRPLSTNPKMAVSNTRGYLILGSLQ